MASGSRFGRKVKPARGFELFAWYFMRISGLILVLLALGHLFITHILNNVEVINYAFVATRWGDPKTGVLWRLWDLTMVNLAVLHGFNGLRQILLEYVTKPGRRVIVTTVIWSATIGLIGIGTYAILEFQANQAYIRRFKAANPGMDAEAASPLPAKAPRTTIARQP